MKLDKLAADTMDSLADNRQSVREFIAALIGEAKAQAARAAKESDDYTFEDLEYWANVEFETRSCSTTLPPRESDPLRNAVNHFLWALDKGCYFTTPQELAESAFVAALRKEVK